MTYLPEAELAAINEELSMRRDIRAALENSISGECSLEDLNDVLGGLAESPELAKEEIQLAIQRLRKIAKLAGIQLFEIN